MDNNSQSSKRVPSRGILKNSSSFDTPHRQHSSSSTGNAKETKWDEMNIMATLHPANKDYGHMKIDEPKTPYNYLNPDGVDGLDADELAKRIEMARNSRPKALPVQEEDTESGGSSYVDDDNDEQLTPEEREKKREFESKRKKHYNEYYAVKLARKLLEEDEDDEEGNSGYQQQCCSK